MRRIHVSDLNLETKQEVNNDKTFITPFAKKVALENSIDINNIKPLHKVKRVAYVGQDLPLFNDTIRNVTIYSERKDKDGNLYNLYLKKGTDNNNFQITYAKKGTFKEFNNIPVLVLYNGATITGKNNEITNFSFPKSDFPLNNFKTNTITQIKTQELSSFNILKCAKFLNSKKKLQNQKIVNCKDSNSSNIYKEIYKRFVIPFYIPLLVLVSLLLTLSSKESLKYRRLKFVTFFSGISFIIFSEATIKYISEIKIQNISISIMPFIFILVLYLIFTKKNYFDYSTK